MLIGKRVKCIREHMGAEIGDEGKITQAADYLPGLDAGCFTVCPDDFPEKSLYGHNGISYWTSNEMFDSWVLIPEKRNILVHLNLELPEGDERSSDEIAFAISGAIEVGSDNEILEGIKIDIPLVEEI